MKAQLLALLFCAWRASAQTSVSIIGTNAVYTPGFWSTNDIWFAGAAEIPASNSVNVNSRRNVIETTKLAAIMHWSIPGGYAHWNQGFWTTNLTLQVSGGGLNFTSTFALPPFYDVLTNDLGLGTNTYPHNSPFTTSNIPSSFSDILTNALATSSATNQVKGQSQAQRIPQ